MKNLTPTRPLVPDFTPVPRKYRYDGWTAERQRAFIDALADLGSVKAACHRVNMSQVGAYYLRRQPGAESFRAAWDAALDHGVQNLADAAMERALHGVPVPIMYQGEQVAERRVYNDRLTMFILRHHMPGRYGELKPLPPGTKHPDTIARDQAGAGEAPLTDEDRLAALRRLEHILDMYRRKVIEEREARRGGRIVEADFAVRQLTHLEVLLEIGGLTRLLVDYANGARDPGAPPEPPIWRTPLTDQLAEARRRAWAETDDLPRPPPSLWAEPPEDGLCGGPDIQERMAARQDAERRMAEAQRDWEAAATAESWARRRAEPGNEPNHRNDNEIGSN